MPTISDLIRERIKTSGTPVSTLSYECRIPLPSLYRFKNQQKKLSTENLEKLAIYFGLSLQPVEK
jgi:hypothetical protein